MGKGIKRFMTLLCAFCLFWDTMLPVNAAGMGSGLNTTDSFNVVSEESIANTEKVAGAEVTATANTVRAASYHIKGNEKWQWPMSDWNRISGCYLHEDPDGKIHNGIDIVRTTDVTQTAAVNAAQKGEVVAVENSCQHVGQRCKCNGRRGNSVFILTTCEDGSSYVSIYMHLEYNKKTVVKVGDVVQKGQKIGIGGNSGDSAGYHLHFEVLHFPTIYDKAKFNKGKTIPNDFLKRKPSDIKKYVIDPLTLIDLSTIAKGKKLTVLKKNKGTCCDQYVTKHTTTKYTITYNANGGSGAPAAQTKTKGINLVLSKTKPTRPGYSFMHWSTGKNNTGTRYAAGATYKTDANMTLYAQWKANTYTVAYNANGGSGAPAGQTKTHGKNLTLSNTEPTRTGYKFMGWNTKADGTGTSYAAGAAYTGNAKLTLYAQWSLIEYTVVFLDGDDKLLVAQSVPYGQAAIAPEIPKKEGYYFVRWDTDFSNVTSNLAVKAIYAELPELSILNQPASQTVMESDNATFTVQAKGEELVYQWQICTNGSDEWSDVTTAGSGYDTGTLTIYAETDMDGAQFRCVITDRFQQQKTSDPAILTVRSKSGVYTITYILNGGTNHPDNVSSYYAWESVTLSEPVFKGKAFGGWFTADGEQVTTVSGGSVTVIAKWLDIIDPGRKDGELWIESIPDQTYTGKAIKPQVKVYNGQMLLQEKKDYTITYVNNIKANDAANEKTAPAVVVSGKGNYSGKEKALFVIRAKDISDEDVSAADVFLPDNDEMPKAVPVLKWNNITLKKGKDFNVEYLSDMGEAYGKSRSYTILVTGKGNYSGRRTVKAQITSSNIMSKANVAKIPSQIYTGREIEPKLTVKYGRTFLEQDIDYTVTYQNNIKAGTATAILTGKGAYVGEKRVTFKITSIAMGKVMVSGLPQSVAYDGNEAYDFSYRLEAVIDNVPVTLVEGEDFEVSYQNNAKAGAMTVKFTGINGYKGTLKKSVKILPYDISVDDKDVIRVSDNLVVPYSKGGAKADPVVTYSGNVLVKGKDYTLQYSNNKSVTQGGAGYIQPTVTIIGKGNFKGRITENFVIEKQNIEFLSMSAPDKVYKNVAGKFASAPVIRDLDGKKLISGVDYDGITYTYAEKTSMEGGRVISAGTRIPATAILPVGTKVTVTVTGKGNYFGKISCTYRISAIDIGKARTRVKDQTYTGRVIRPGKEAVTIIVGGNVLSDSDYEIVSYSNNVKKGTATMVIKGVGEYGGTKRITFRIKARGITWWWR